MFKKEIYNERLVYDWDVDIDTGWKEWQSIVLQALILGHTMYHTVRKIDIFTLVRNQLDVLDIQYKSVEPNSDDERLALSQGDTIGLESAIELYLNRLVRDGYLIDLSKDMRIKVDGYQITNDMIQMVII